MSDSSNKGIGILAGLAAGAILGILYAPDKGSATRNLIKKKATEASDKLAVEAENLKHTIVDEAGTLKSKLVDEANNLKTNVVDTINAKSQTLDEQLETIVTNTSYKAEDLITTLENKLALLKEKNKQIRKTTKKNNSSLTA